MWALYVCRSFFCIVFWGLEEVVGYRLAPLPATPVLACVLSEFILHSDWQPVLACFFWVHSWRVFMRRILLGFLGFLPVFACPRLGRLGLAVPFRTLRPREYVWVWVV